LIDKLGDRIEQLLCLCEITPVRRAYTVGGIPNHIPGQLVCLLPRIVRSRKARPRRVSNHPEL
jgi:hypothetical protein